MFREYILFDIFNSRRWKICVNIGKAHSFYIQKSIEIQDMLYTVHLGDPKQPGYHTPIDRATAITHLDILSLAPRNNVLHKQHKIYSFIMDVGLHLIFNSVQIFLVVWIFIDASLFDTLVNLISESLQGIVPKMRIFV